MQGEPVRSPDDADALAAAGVHVRLVQGAYLEPAGAHPYSEATDVAYLRLAFRLAAAGATWSMATHDGRLREAVLLALGPVPVEQLLGVRPDVLEQLRERRPDPRLRPLRPRLVPLLATPRRRIPRHLTLPVTSPCARREASAVIGPGVVGGSGSTRSTIRYALGCGPRSPARPTVGPDQRPPALSLPAGRHLDRGFDAARDRTRLLMGGQRSVRGVPLVGGHVDTGVAHVDAFDDQDLAVELDLPTRVSHQTGGIYSPGLEGTGERPGESTGGGTNYVVESGCVVAELPRRITVVLGHGTVRPVVDRLGLRRQVGPPYWAALALDANLRDVRHVAHRCLRSRHWTTCVPPGLPGCQ